MAVIKSKRQENPLQVLGLARELALHTLNICNTEKVFPKRDRWMLTGEIVRTALLIYIHIRHANCVKVEETADYTRRMELQQTALEEINDLLGLIDIAGVRYHLPGNRQSYWTGLALNLERKARAWHRSDQARLKPGIVLEEIHPEDEAPGIIPQYGGTALKQQMPSVAIISGSGAV